MDFITLGVNLEFNTPDTPVGFKISFDDVLLHDSLLTNDNSCIEVKLKDNIDIREQKFLNMEMYGKTDNHTILDDNGNIIQTSMIEIIDLYIDNTLFIYDGGMACSLWDSIKYHHNNNGHSDDVVESVSILMGMNGKLVIPIYTPIYIWMFENLYGTKPI